MDAHRREFRVGTMCEVLGVSRSGYYAWRRRLPSRRDEANAKLTDTIRQLHEGQREARKQLYRSLREARRTLREMVIDGVDDATVQQQTAALQQLLGQAVQMRTESLRAVSQVLTPEQRQKFREMRPRWH